MKLPLITPDDEKLAEEKLKSYYDLGLIPPEKKGYLTRLENSASGFLGVESKDGTHYLLDAGSQIATLGLGLNPSTFFGTAHFLASWTGNPDCEEFQRLRTSFRDILLRRAGWKKGQLTFCHSGAEANETALGMCYRQRQQQEANKVLCFEGSFHGRMIVSLAASWNKSKREPFEVEGFKATYCPYPVSADGTVDVKFPTNWRAFWSHSSKKDLKIPADWKIDELLQSEIDSLMSVREKLLAGDIFAIVLEPMQCEGGDRYSTSRFNNALLLLARCFGIPVIYDEVQTGFHLGRSFFWHRQFELKNAQGRPLYPDYIVCAKKAQVGLVLSRKNHEVREEFQVASAVRGHLHALALDQRQPKIIWLEDEVQKRLKELTASYPDQMENPRAHGMAFAFDLKDSSLPGKFVNERFKHGLLFYPAGDRTLRFRANLAWGKAELDFLFERLDKIAKFVFSGESDEIPSEAPLTGGLPDNSYAWHRLLLRMRLGQLQGSEIRPENVWGPVVEQMNLHKNQEMVLIDKSNFERFREDIQKLQTNNYEETRRTDIEKFQLAAEAPNSVCLGVIDDTKLKAIAFAGPIEKFPLERGVRTDPYFGSGEVLYMIDTTVDKDLQSQGMGKKLKYALTAIAMAKGVKRIHGRNRDKLAGSMLTINLSLGSYVLQYLPEDYPDFEAFRDVHYYSTPLTWELGPHYLTDGIRSPQGTLSLETSYHEEQLPYLINKVCLSNFVSERFLGHVKELFELLPKELRHGYTASGQSEAVDKIAKSLWYAEKAKGKAFRHLTFKGHTFGAGGFLARSLSSSKDPYFPVDHLDDPSRVDPKKVLQQVEEALSSNDYLAVWIEPLPQAQLSPVPRDFLVDLKKLCQKKGVALVFNETASGLYRYRREGFFACGDDLVPDAFMSYLGGQAALIGINENYFLAKPLMMISTWDGDEFSFANYRLAATKVQEDPQVHFGIQDRFQEKLTKLFEEHHISKFVLNNGVGRVQGALPEDLRHCFQKVGRDFLICPSRSTMERFLNKGS